MSRLSTINQVIATTILLPDGKRDGPAAQVRQGLAVGLELDDGRRHWAECPAPDGELEVYRQTLEEIVSPALRGLSPGSWEELCRQVHALRRTTLLEEELPPDPAGDSVTSPERRLILRGLQVEPKKIARRTLEVVQPLPLPLLLALECAGLAAWQAGVSHRETRPPTYRLAPLPETVPHAAAVGHTAALFAEIPQIDIASHLGRENERLQRYLRQLAGWLREVQGQRLADGSPRSIILHLHGALDLLYEGNLGRILGALYGLEQAAAPCPLLLIEPLQNGNDTDARSAELLEMMRFRRLQSQLLIDAQPGSLPVSRPATGTYLSCAAGLWPATQMLAGLAAHDQPLVFDGRQLPPTGLTSLWRPLPFPLPPTTFLVPAADPANTLTAINLNLLNQAHPAQTD